MTKETGIPENILKPDPAREEMVRKVILQMIQPLDEDQEGLITDLEWRAWMDRVEARISRLEEAAKQKEARQHDRR